MTTIVFSHANGFPASTYRVLFRDLRRRGFRVRAIERLGHDPELPVNNNWSHLVREVARFAAAEVERAGEPVVLAGHSLGGILSLMAAARHPELAAGVLLIDSPVPSGWRAATLGLAKRTPLLGALSPGAVSVKRRQVWPSREDALNHFLAKKAFAAWDRQVLRDYIDHGMHDAPGPHGSTVRKLNFERDIETAIYNTLPDNIEPVLRRHPLKCPAAFIGSRTSAEMKQLGTALVEKLTHGRMTWLDGSHLFPMEQPIATAAAIEASILNFSRA